MIRVRELNSTEPLVSVKMITYNHLRFLEAAVNGVLDQQVDFGVELVIGEDCSTDGTRDLAFRLQKEHPWVIRVVTGDKNVGARTNGVRTEAACRGKYVAFCEGDDYWNEPLKLAKQISFLESRPDYSLVHSHCHRYLVSQKRLLCNSLSVPTDLDDANAYEDILVERRCPLTVSVVAPRAALVWVRANCPECNDPRWPMGDTQTWLELARRGKVGCIHEPLATTNILTESAGQSRDPQKRLRFFKAARELKLHYLAKYPVSPEVARLARRKIALVLLQYAYVACDRTFAEQMYEEMLANGGSDVLRAKWLRWGSRSRAHRNLVVPLVFFEYRWRNLKKRFPSSRDQSQDLRKEVGFSTQGSVRN